MKRQRRAKLAERLIDLAEDVGHGANRLHVGENGTSPNVGHLLIPVAISLSEIGELQQMENEDETGSVVMSVVTVLLRCVCLADGCCLEVKTFTASCENHEEDGPVVYY